MARMTLLALSLTACVVNPDKDTPAPTTPRYTEAVLREPVRVNTDWADSADLVFDETRELRRFVVHFRSGATVTMTTQPELGEADMFLELADGRSLKTRSEIQWDGDTVWLGFLDLKLPYAYALD